MDDDVDFGALGVDTQKAAAACIVYNMATQKNVDLIDCALQVIDLIPRVTTDGHTLMVNIPTRLLLRILPSLSRV